ncbi:MAG: hypothetical protein ACI9JN_002465 [Bacteroidia bacterium]|jgi:hypothetical protein
MKTLFGYIAIFLLIGCSTDEGPPCLGHAIEPNVFVSSNRDTFQIVHSNSSGVSGRINIIKNRSSPPVPIDMNDSIMTYEVFAHDTLFGSFRLKYEMKPKLCGSRQYILLVFTNAIFSRIENQHSITYSFNGKPFVDSTENVSSSLDQFGSNVSLEF